MTDDDEAPGWDVIQFIVSTGKAVFVGHRIATLVLAVGMAGLVAGCSSGSGNPQPSSSGAPQPSSPASSSSSGGAPHVSNPLDTSKFQAAPCTVLSTAEAQSFGASAPGRTKSDALKDSCIWSRDTGGFYVSFEKANKNGLSTIYQKRHEVGLFEELPPVQGYPAVISGQVDSRSEGTCSIYVGVSDSLEYYVWLQAPTGPPSVDPCGAVQRIATTVLGHLKSGGS